ncbi:hypothetical protein [Nocardia wallacei]|uniref:hypothetical protein n=1 Tax=Nocardia wallacei TaxID=480035 RepID=UPI0024585C7D|nr:hypothetical protein [Nocardia wallacei]
MAVVAVSTACAGDTASGPWLTITDYRGTDWVTDGTVKPPATPDREDRVRYPHSMDGAVMAAVDSQTLLDTASDTEFGAVARDYFTAGDGLNAYAAARAQLTVHGIDHSRVPRVRGFRFFGYDDTTATVEVFTEQPDHSVTGLVRRLVWLGENWLIQLPAPKTEKTITAYPVLPGDVNPLPQT